VPGDDDPPTELPEPIRTAHALPHPANRTAARLKLGVIGGGVLTLLLVGALLAWSGRSQPEAPATTENVDASRALASVTATEAPAATRPPLSDRRIPQAPPPHQAAPPQVQATAAVLAQPSVALTPAPPPRPVVHRPAPGIALDQYGNPVSPSMGLGKEYEFKGKKLLFWSGYERAGVVFFGPANPLWKAWEQLGFTVIIKFGRFRPEWLRDIDQLWILSTGALQLPAGAPPQMLINAVDLLPASEIPSGFTGAEYKFIVAATLDMSLSPVHHFDEAAYRAVIKFVQSGKGLCLLADDEPFTIEANELARRLYGVGVKGNYIADKVAYVRDRGLTRADIRKFGGQYEVADHPLLRGVNFLFEGITVSNVGLSDKLEVALRASDGQPLIVVSRAPGQRVVIDCAFTQFCHGPTERTSYIQKSAGAVRLAQNIAAYLAGKDGE
jgi:hypothetical protein